MNDSNKAGLLGGILRDAIETPPEAAPTPPPAAAPVDPLAPAWRISESSFYAAEARVTLRRNAPVETSTSQILERRASEALAAWLQTAAALKYLRLRDKLVATQEELSKAMLQEARANLSYNAAVQTADDADGEAATWQAARAEVEDATARLGSIRDAAEMAYIAAIDSYGQHAAQIQLADSAASEKYAELLAELAAAMSPILDELFAARQIRDRKPQMKPFELAIPPLPTLNVNLDPPPVPLHQPIRGFGFATARA